MVIARHNHLFEALPNITQGENMINYIIACNLKKKQFDHEINFRKIKLI